MHEFQADVGQEEDLEQVREQALKLGAIKVNKMENLYRYQKSIPFSCNS